MMYKTLNILINMKSPVPQSLKNVQKCQVFTVEVPSL